MSSVSTTGAAAGGRAGRLPASPAVLCLAAAVAASAATLLVMQSHLTFIYDDWSLLIYRRGFSPGVFLDPDNGHIYAGPVLIYKILLKTFGMSSALPFQIVSTALLSLTAVLLFIYTRRRVGDWLALAGTALVLLFGASWLNLLVPFQMGLSGSLAAGIGAMLALERGDRRGDLTACGLLVVSVSFSELGVPFALAALVQIALERRSISRRVYLAVLPLALYAIWWLGWGHTAESFVSVHNVVGAPRYTLDAASAAVAALLGLLGTPHLDAAGIAEPPGLNWGRILLAVGVGLLVLRFRSRRQVPTGLWVALAAGLSFWVLTGFNRNVFRDPFIDRYLYPSAIFLLMIAANALSGVRLRRPGLLVCGAVVVASVASNFVLLHDAYDDFFRPATDNIKADLATLEITGDVRPNFVLSVDDVPLWLVPITTRDYLSAARAYGSPAYSEQELAARPEPVRKRADGVLALALGLHLEPGGRLRPPCRDATASADPGSVLELGPGRHTLEARGGEPVRASAGRFSDEQPVDLGVLRPRRPARLEIPADRSGRPWRLALRGGGRVAVCG